MGNLQEEGPLCVVNTDSRKVIIKVAVEVKGIRRGDYHFVIDSFL